MKRQLLLALLAAGLAAAPGCADKRDAVPGIRITPSIKTRVTGLHFDTGDCIGLTVTKNGSDYVRNHQMTYDGSAFTASGLLWYNDLNETSTLTAYFPYSASGVPDEFSVARDQSAGCASSDLLGAVAKNVTPTGTPVGMLFYHLMSQLTIVITNNSDAAVSGVAVGGFVPTASVDLSVPTASAKAGAAAAEIETFEVTPDASYRAILVPQQGALTVTVSTRDGKSRSKTLSSATLESGRRYDMSVLVTNIDIELKLSGEVSDWEDGGSLDEGDGGEASELEYGGDTYRTAKIGGINDWGEGGSLDGDDGGDDTGGDTGELSYGGDTYPTATIGGQVWMAENLRYQPAGTEIGDGVWYPEEGLSAVAEKGLLYDYKTVTGGATVRSGTPLRGICPEGWHVPALAELEALLAAGPAAGFFRCAGYWIVNGTSNRYGDADKGYLISCEATAERSGCLVYSTTTDPVTGEVPLGYGLSVRCVKDDAVR